MTMLDTSLKLAEGAREHVYKFINTINRLISKPPSRQTQERRANMAPHVAAGRLFPEKLNPVVQLELLMDFVLRRIVLPSSLCVKCTGIRLLPRKCWCEFGKSLHGTF